MNDREFLAAFEACTLPPDHFDHRQHVRVAWIYLREHDVLEALRRFEASLKRYAGNLGKSAIYHETITWAYVFLIHDRIQRAPSPAPDFDAFADANEDLVTWKPSVLDRYYRTETLSSEAARRTFLFPDL